MATCCTASTALTRGTGIKRVNFLVTTELAVYKYGLENFERLKMKSTSNYLIRGLTVPQ